MPTIYVGSVGQSVWRSRDGGASFHRASKGMWSESDIRALMLSPHDSQTLYAGTEDGVFKTENGGDEWTRLGGELAGKEIWSVGASPHDPNLLIAGTCPAALYASEDGGGSWFLGKQEIAQDCFGGSMKTRVTSILPHPTKPDILFAGIEVDGPRVSDDRGKTWRRLGLPDVDVHDMKMLSCGTLFASANNEVYRSGDEGQNWEPLNIKEHFEKTYCRGMGAAPDGSDALYVGNGDGPPGSVGAVYRTRDKGGSWERVPLNAPANSTVWQFASAGGWMAATTVLGQAFRSVDSGENWAKLAWEFGEVRGLALAEQ